MAHTLASLLLRVKDDPTRIVDPHVFGAAAASLDHARQLELFGPARRSRVLTPLMTVTAVIVQALHGNTALCDLGRKTGLHVTASAFCRARQRVPLALFEALAVRMAHGLLERTEDVGDSGGSSGGDSGGDSGGSSGGRWHGWRVFLLDGTSVSMPDTEANAEHFGKPFDSGTRRPLLPVGHLLGMVDLATGLIVRVCVHRWNTHDLQSCPKMHEELAAPALGPGDLLLADRAFGGLTHLAAVMYSGLDAVLRVKEKGHLGGKAAGGRGGRTSGGMPRLRGAVTVTILEDTWVTRKLTRQCPPWLDPVMFVDLGPKVRFRRVVYTLQASGYRSRRVCLHTSVRGVPAEDLAALYLKRWQIEVHYRALKRTLGAAVLKGQTPDVVLKELWGYVMAYNLVRVTAINAATRQGVPIDRISFTDVWRHLKQALTPVLCLLAGLHRVTVNPFNPRHWEPRIRKRPPPNYPLMTKPRDEYFTQLPLASAATKARA